jgi:hypothetical protein
LRQRRNSRLHDRAHIETVYDVDLRLRTPRLHCHVDTNFMPVPSGTRMLSEGLLTFYEKMIDAQAKIDMESRK